MAKQPSRIHWYLDYSNKTACGKLAYPTDVTDEYDTPTNGRLECTKDQRKVTCANCEWVMKIGQYDKAATGGANG